MATLLIEKRLKSSVIVGIVVAFSIGVVILLVAIWLFIVKNNGEGRSKYKLAKAPKVLHPGKS